MFKLTSIFCCKECNNPNNIKVSENEVSPGIWECPRCGHPHSEGELMEYLE